MKRPFFGCVLFALPLLAFVACGDESAINVNSVKQIAADDEAQDDDDSKNSDTPVSSEKQSSKSSSSTKSSSSAKAESSENDEVDSVDDLPRCSIKREGVEIYVKENKTHYTCEDGEWIAEKKTPEDSKKSSSSEADEAPKSSSSVIYLDVDFSSSSTKVTTVPVTGLGSCQPVTPVINKGESTKWKFSANVASDRNAFDFVKATYAWNFGAGATPATDATSGTSAAISYANSGVAVASVTVTMPDGSFETVQCEPLQVNGDPITGCKCDPVGVTGSVDYTATPDVTWSVTGCMTASTPLTYYWNGADGSESFTYSFTAATASYAPTLKVGNADNSIIDVTCSAVKVTEGPEYEIAVRGSDGEIDLPMGISMVHLNIPKNEFFNNCMIRCKSDNGQFTVSIDELSAQSAYYVSVRLPDGSCNDQMVEFELSSPARCSVE